MPVLYQALITLMQEPRQDALASLVKVLEIQQKVMFASHTDPAVKYNQMLVKGLFLQTLEVELINENRVKMRPTLF